MDDLFISALPEESLKPPYLLKIWGNLEEYFSLDEIKSDYIEGLIMAQSSANVLHERCFMKLANLLFLFTTKNQIGEVFGSRLMVSLDENNKFEPDLFFVSHKNTGTLTDLEFVGIPDLIIEIVSEITQNYDLTVKREIYQKFQIPEICFINLAEKTIILDLLEGEHYKSFKVDENGEKASIVLNGFKWNYNAWKIL